ncbi:WD40 repeat-like protein, partial [Rhizopogon vinicolor AM-OR11-026]
DDVAGVVLFPDRRRMATNSKDGFLRVWDLKDGAILKEMDARGQAMRDVVLSQDGQLIASCDYGGYVIAWHGDTLTEVFRNQSGASSLDFSPDGATLATGSYGSTTLDIQIWNIILRRRIAIIGQNYTHSLAWMPDGTRLLSAGNPNVREWDSSTLKEVGCSDLWKGDTGSSCQCIAVNCNGTLVAYQTTDNHVRLWRPSDQRTIAIFQHSDSPCCISFSVDGKHILAGGKDKKILEW